MDYLEKDSTFFERFGSAIMSRARRGAGSRPCPSARPAAAVLVLVLVLLGAAVAEAQTAAADKAALEAIYDATGGAQWTRGLNWKTSSPLNEWEDVATNADGRVETLYLDYNNLNGSLPSALWNLTELKQLLLAGNPMLTGSIPAEVENLSKLENFGAEESSLNGGIPVALGNLSQLKYLWLHKNSLSGSIPAELGKLTNLIQLHLNDNSLSGTIPAALGGLTSLTNLELQNNELSGEIPAELGNLANLVYLYLHSNQLSGEVPVELGQLTELRGVQLQDNTDLTGVIPFDARQTGLGQLGVSNTDLCAPPTLHAYWDQNLASYDGQVCTMSMTDRTLLESLHDSLAGDNWDDSTNWKSIQPLADWYGVETNEAGRVTGLSLPGNGLAGEIPAGLGDLTWLETLDLSGNNLTGVIPDALEALIRLRRVDLSGNTLTGGAPSWLGDLDRLEHLDLSDTQLSGSIPSSFTRTSALRTLDVSGTTVCMPPDLDFQNWLDGSGIVYRGDRCERTDRAALVALYYATDGPSWSRRTNNWLSDAPLNEWAGVGANADNRVTFVQISGFGLKGTIPRELGDLEFLERLALESNELTGPLPSELGKLTRLELLWVGQTGLTGPIPIELQQLPLTSLRIDETDLCVPRRPTFRTWLETVLIHPLTLETCPGGGGPPPPPPPPPVPDAPTNLLLEGGDKQVKLTWEAPENDGGSAITDYEYRIDGKGDWISIGSTDTTHTVTGLVNGTEYVFQVRAVTAAGSSAPSNRVEATPIAPVTLLVANFSNGNNEAFNSRVYLWNPSTSAGQVTVRVFTLPLTTGIARELTGPPLDLGTLEARSALNLKLVEDILIPLGIALPYTTDGGNLTLEFTIQAVDVRGAAQVFSSDFAFGTYPMQEIPSTSSGSPTVLVANFTNANNAALHSRVYLWNPSATDGRVTARVFTLPNTGDSMRLLTVPLGILKAFSARNIRIAEDILDFFSGIALPYTDDGGNLTLEFTIEAPDVKGAAQVFSSDFAFGTYPLQEIPSTSSGSPTVLVANFTNGNNGALHSRVYLWNPSASAGEVTVRVFTLPLTGDSSLLGTLDLESLQAESARNLKLAEDILIPLGITLPYTTDGGNLTLEFTIQAADVRGTAQVFSSDFAFGTYPMQEIPSTSSGSPTVLVANFMNGNDAALNSRVYLWNPSLSAGSVTVRVFTLPLTAGVAQELTTAPLDLGTLGAESARNLKLVEDILTPLGIPTPYVTDGGNLTLEFTIQAADVRGAAQVFSSSFAFGTVPLQVIQ